MSTEVIDNKEEDRALTEFVRILKLFSGEIPEHELFPILDQEFTDFDINVQDHTGQSFLHHTMTNVRYYIMEYLLKKGANPNAQDIHGETPLILAARKGLLTHIQLLMAHGANPDIYDKHNDSALLWAAYRNYLDIVIFLVENGANTKHVYQDGKEAIRWAIKGGNLDIVSYLADDLMEINRPDRNGNGVLDMTMTSEITEFFYTWLEKNKVFVARHIKNKYNGRIDYEILRIIFSMYHR